MEHDRMCSRVGAYDRREDAICPWCDFIEQVRHDERMTIGTELRTKQPPVRTIYSLM